MEAAAPKAAPRAGGSDELYSADEAGSLILYWAVFWFVAHYVLWALWKCDRVYTLVWAPTGLDRYRRRLCRSQVYCAVAVVGGVRLLSRCRWHPHDLLYEFSVEHQLFFSMAAGHWLVAIWEDIMSWNFLRGGLSAEGTSGDDPGALLVRAYVLHHLVAGAGFSAMLVLRACTGIGAFGLLFELPVLLLNHREFELYADRLPEWYRDYQYVDQLWNLFDLFWFIARIGPTLVYIYSVLFWFDDLSALSRTGLIVYHSMAIFFTVLNTLYRTTFLRLWSKKDRDAAELCEASNGDTNGHLDASVAPSFGKEEMTEEEEDEDEDDDRSDEARKTTLVRVPDGYLSESRGEQNEAGEVWLEVDGIAYNVTDFLGSHPGGEATLRNYAGKDASQAFHRVRHSMNAKIMMQKYAVGPIMRQPKSYRIFEHRDDLKHILQVGAAIALAHGVIGFLLPRSIVGGMLPSQGPEASLGEMLAPGLTLTAVAGVNVLVLMVLRGSFTLAGFSRRSHVIAACMVACLVGLSLARQPMPEGLPRAAPSGLELGLVGIFAAEEALELLGGRGEHRSLLPLILGPTTGVVSWLLRGAPALLASARGHVLAAALLGTSWPCLSRVGANTRKYPVEALTRDLVTGMCLAGVYSTLGLLYLSSVNPVIEKAVRALSESPVVSLFLAEVVAVASLVAMSTSLNFAFLATPAWSMRCLAIVYGLACVCGGGLGSWRWLSWSAGVLHLGAMASRNKAKMQEAAENGTFATQVSTGMLGTRALWDLVRLVYCFMGWLLVVKPVMWICNWVLPEEMTVFALQIPLFDLGDGADLGIAAYFAPEAGLESQEGPQHFVCNVGHIAKKHKGGIIDLQLTMNALRDVWMEFKRPDMEGLLANIVCVFPNVGNRHFAKEINLSCWRSAADAGAWYMRSEGHARIMRHHAGGGLKTFGNLLASLKPHGGIRHQDRCSSCARLVESDTLGEHAPRRCRACGGRAYGYPWF